MRNMKKNIEKEWRAESDARILEDYEDLIKDPNRLKSAMKKAKEIKEDLEGRIRAIDGAVRRKKR